MHLYLGCFFAPLLILFAVSGAFQTFELHSDKKSGFKAPKIIKAISEVHIHQRIKGYDYKKEKNINHSPIFRIFVLFLVIGFITTTVLGIIMAYQFIPQKSIVWTLLISGAFIPFMILWISMSL